MTGRDGRLRHLRARVRRGGVLRRRHVPRLRRARRAVLRRPDLRPGADLHRFSAANEVCIDCGEAGEPCCPPLGSCLGGLTCNAGTCGP